MKYLKPLKKFGQNYLTDKNTIVKIAETILPENYDHVIEIGPGKGSLTRELFRRNKNISCFEIDTRVIEELHSEFRDVKIYNCDFLEINLRDFINPDEKTVICGNIPYNITSPIIFKLVNEYPLVSDVVLMMQNEVAKRIIARPHTKEYGILSVILGYFADIEFCFKIPPTVFYPRPKVDSAILKISFKSKLYPKIDNKLFIQVVKASFNNRRKTLKNSLSNSIFANENIFNSGFDFTRRAEELSVEEFIVLTELIAHKLQINNEQ
jgi:16S rRNA (adenine1518-N6/adenine1519-N6)-dimethyltransferase